MKLRSKVSSSKFYGKGARHLSVLCVLRPCPQPGVQKRNVQYIALVLKSHVSAGIRTESLDNVAYGSSAVVELEILTGRSKHSCVY